MQHVCYHTQHNFNYITLQSYKCKPFSSLHHHRNVTSSPEMEEMPNGQRALFNLIYESWQRQRDMHRLIVKKKLINKTSQRELLKISPLSSLGNGWSSIFTDPNKPSHFWPSPAKYKAVPRHIAFWKFYWDQFQRNAACSRMTCQVASIH